MGESEFWLLFLLYVKHILSKWKSANPNNLNAVEEQIVPLIDRFNFLSECKDLRALSGILDSLKSEGFVLPFSTRKQLCSQLLRRALNANSVAEAQSLVDYAKCIVDFSFHALREAMFELGFGKSSNEKMLYVVQEKICSSIFDQDRLLEYVLEKEAKEEEEGLMKSRLAIYLGNGLQSKDSETRLLAIKLACSCCFNSRLIFCRLLPIFETALYHEDCSMREYVLACLMDLIFIHHSTIRLQTVFHFISPFLYAPTPTLQLAAVIGCGRLLLYDCFPDETECLLSMMLQRHVYRLPDYCSLTSADKIVSLQAWNNFNQNGKLQKVAQALHFFFLEYSGDKKLHQDEIANTLVYMSLQKIEEGVVCVDTAKKQIEDNPLKAKEASDLHMALKLGLSLCSDALEAVVDSLILNINEDSHIPVLDKAKCVQWFLSK